jgi:hypothetical protein
MTARILLILEKARGHSPRLQKRLGDLCKALLCKGESVLLILRGVTLPLIEGESRRQPAGGRSHTIYGFR